MGSFLKYARTFLRLRKPPLQPLRFPTTGFDIVGNDYWLEEESSEAFRSGWYCPVCIGDVFASKYQVLGKLGFGVTSTVWLARNLQDHDFATLKVFIRQGLDQDESEVYQRLSKGNSAHPGYQYVRTVSDAFTISRAGGDHKCLVQKPMWDSFEDILNRNPAHRLPETILKPLLAQIFLALDYLHTECQLVHTDIKGENILMEISDNNILEAFVMAEMEAPSARKTVGETTIYASRTFDRPKRFGKAVLSDFGSAARGDEKPSHFAQPNIYRSPEVMLKAEWSYPIDVWNVGCMIWDLFEDKHLFSGRDPDGSGYTTSAHLAEIMALLGPPPLELVQRGERGKEFFNEDGTCKAEVPIPALSLENSEEMYQGKEKEEFLRFILCMLQWRPEDRKTAYELFNDPYLKGVLK